MVGGTLQICRGRKDSEGASWEIPGSGECEGRCGIGSKTVDLVGVGVCGGE
jgi:hypothetical protein